MPVLIKMTTRNPRFSSPLSGDGSVFHFRESDYSSSVCYDQVLSKYKAGCTMLVAVNFMNWVKVTYVSEWVFIRRDFSFFRKLYDLLPSTIQGTVRTV